MSNTNKRLFARRWVQVVLIFAAIGVIATAVLFRYAGDFKRGLEEKARQQVVAYLEEHFESDAQFQSIRFRLPPVSALNLFLKRGRGVIATVEGNGLLLRRRVHPDLPPLFKLAKFQFDIDVGMLLVPNVNVARLQVEGMEINIPPKERRTPMKKPDGSGKFDVVISEIIAKNAVLMILPRDSRKPPLRFDIDRVRLTDAGRDKAMEYQATLTNPRPPGLIQSAGTFGPWNADEPSDTNLSGAYQFDHADLGIFKGISGILFSTGKFEGSLGEINVHGEARVPEFALKSAGNKVPLATTFEALVDGTNGDTVLKPVNAKLGNTAFVTSGAIIKHEEFGKRVITLAVRMPHGDMRDLLRLAMKGEPFMSGTIRLNSKIAIPPQSIQVREKLQLDGTFVVEKGLFARDAIQDKVDELSRRGQGKPKNNSIDNVISNMRGQFVMREGTIAFSPVSFDVPGAAVNLTGTYDLSEDQVDFHGQLRLDAKVSQTLTGWKRWVAKPLDPFFSKDGAGTLLKIQVVGSGSHPNFGLDHRRSDATSDQKHDDRPASSRNPDNNKAER